MCLYLLYTVCKFIDLYMYVGLSYCFVTCVCVCLFLCCKLSVNFILSVHRIDVMMKVCSVCCVVLYYMHSLREMIARKLFTRAVNSYKCYLAFCQKN